MVDRLWYFLMIHVYPHEQWVYDHVRSYREWWGER